MDFTRTGVWGWIRGLGGGNTYDPGAGPGPQATKGSYLRALRIGREHGSARHPAGTALPLRDVAAVAEAVPAARPASGPAAAADQHVADAAVHEVAGALRHVAAGPLHDVAGADTVVVSGGPAGAADGGAGGGVR